jgi:hypothetical protein
MNLNELVADVMSAIIEVDAARVSFRAFQPGVGPYGELQLVKAVAAYLNRIPKYPGSVRTKRCPTSWFQTSGQRRARFGQFAQARRPKQSERSEGYVLCARQAFRLQ